MKKVIQNSRVAIIVICVLFATILFDAYFMFKFNARVAGFIYFVFVLLLTVSYFILKNNLETKYSDIESKISSATKIALEEGKIGILVYDKNYKIVYMSELLRNKMEDHVGDKLLNYLPELQDVVDNSIDKKMLVFNDDKYEVTKQENNPLLIFRDVTFEYDIKQRLDKEAYVLGLCNFDNYDETSETEENISFVNSSIKVPVVDYFRKQGVIYKTLRNNRLQLILNKEQYDSLLKDRFSICNYIRKEAKKVDMDITLSMSFAIDYENLQEMDQEAQNLLELAQTRGGDQVIVKEKGKEPVFYGGSSEAKERTSKVKVRVIANTLKKLIAESSKVMIVGHIDSDSDCIGSMLGMSAIAKGINENTYVVSESGAIEPMTKDVIKKYREQLETEHNLISENDALIKLDDNTLVIMCDHHSVSQSNCQALLTNAKKIIVIDHHRRKADLDFDPILLYVEASASSTCELICEFFDYLPRTKVSDVDANLMYLGMVIDTNHFRVRTGAATFEAAKNLRRLGANPELVESLSQEPYENIQKRTSIISRAKAIKDNILLAKMPEGEIFSRSIASQAVDSLIQTKGIEAAFVICNTSKEDVMISARSKGEMNVQLILEKMNGGGHKTAAGLQRKFEKIDDLSDELLKSLYEYLNEKELEKHESNIA